MKKEVIKEIEERNKRIENLRHEVALERGFADYYKDSALELIEMLKEANKSLKKMEEEKAITYSLEINPDPIVEGKPFRYGSKIVKEDSKALEVNERFIKNLAEELSEVKDKSKQLNDELAEKDRLIGNLARELVEVNEENRQLVARTDWLFNNKPFPTTDKVEIVIKG